MNRDRRERVVMDGAAVAWVREAAHRDPDSPTARSGFADRALAAPAVPAWIHWLYDRSPETARLAYHLHYPLDDGYDDRDYREARIIARAYRAESAARAVQRSRRYHGPGPSFAYTPELPDDDDFYAAWDIKQEWTGHWYSRDPREAWPEVHGLR
ncbi:hypothetical protein [Nocardia sp. NPDC004860]|uniref:hypothetical protein n=1 Tax=Nocardia sp. NPDC004860 TaxID=3154557 RepID=UPI0033A109E1